MVPGLGQKNIQLDNRNYYDEQSKHNAKQL